jgi:ATP-dependent Lon protease
VIDDLETFVTTAVEGQAQLVYFYFSFADTQKQSLQSFLRSAVAQLCHIKPVFDRLKLMKGSSSTGAPSSQDLRKIFELALEHTRLFVVIDALDEVPEHQDQRQDVLDWITRTVAAFGDKMKIFATSRAEQDIKAMMLDAVQIDIHRAIVDADIATYVSNELERDGRLRKLSDDLKLHIKQELSSKADGM